MTDGCNTLCLLMQQAAFLVHNLDHLLVLKSKDVL